MDPCQFLQFARTLLRLDICDEETDARVGVDRCYYAVAHGTWGAIEDILNQVSPYGAARSLALLKEKIHFVLKEVLLEIDSKLKTRVADLYRRRNKASYHMQAVLSREDLEDTIEMADWVISNQELVKEELQTAHESGLLSDGWWDELRDEVRRRYA